MRGSRFHRHAGLIGDSKRPPGKAAAAMIGCPTHRVKGGFLFCMELHAGSDAVADCVEQRRAFVSTSQRVLEVGGPLRRDGDRERRYAAVRNPGAGAVSGSCGRDQQRRKLQHRVCGSGGDSGRRVQPLDGNVTISGGTLEGRCLPAGYFPNRLITSAGERCAGRASARAIPRDTSGGLRHRRQPER